MDTLLHTTVGICSGELIAGKQLGRKAMIIGAIFNNLPDADVITQLWLPTIDGLLSHRGFTHSILFTIVAAPLFAFFFWKWFKKISFARWLLLTASGLALHILLDACTVYGTGLFEPFNNARISFNTIFIIDPFFGLPVLAGAIALLILKKNAENRMKWARYSLLISGLYLLSTVFNKLHIDKVVERNIRTQQLTTNNYMATPTPLNNFLWYVIASNKTEHYVGYYSLFDGDQPISFYRIPRNDSLLYRCYSDDVHNFIRFTKGYYSAFERNDTIIMNDMRFGQNGGWYQPDAPFIFNFFVLQGYCSNLQQGRFGTFSRKPFFLLVKRIKGPLN